MELYKTLLVLQCVVLQLKLVLNAPCGVLVANSECTQNKDKASARNIRSHKRKNQVSLLATMLRNDDVFFGQQQIVFPDSYEVLLEPIAPIEKAPTCEDGLSLCENIATYPHKRVQEALGKTDHRAYFGVDEIPNEFSIREGEDDENFICGSIQTTIFPKAGKNKNNKWKYIINQGETEGFIQGIRIEKCAQFDGPCNLVYDAPVGYVARCKQKYVLRRLLSLTASGEPVPDSFKIPSACCCAFKRNFNILSGFGRSVTPSRPRI